MKRRLEIAGILLVAAFMIAMFWVGIVATYMWATS